MRSFVFLLTLVALGNCGAAAEKPNIVFILADDLGARDLSCYGSTFHETPNLDRLANEGLRFTQAYSAGAVCSPTRSSIMSGKVPPRTGVTDYIPGLTGEGRKLVTKRTKTELGLEEDTIAESLRAGGYQTFFAGKWHLGDKGFEPKDQGFEICILDHELGNHGKDWQVGKRLTDSAVAFLDDHDSKRPFFMYLAYHEPHTPILEYPDYIDKFRDKASKLPVEATQTRIERNGQTRIVQDNPAYASEVAGLDSFVGSVLKKLEQNQLADNTIVIFFSDNGGLSTKESPGPTSNEPLRAGKGWLYEGGIRVPLIIRAPRLTKPNTTTDAQVLSTDFYPTLLELAGLPPKPNQHLDGVSIQSVLRGKASLEREALYWHYPHYHGSTWAPGGAMREGDWKLIEFFEEGTAELYNLKGDLSETQDLAAKMPEKLASMKWKLEEWRKQVGALIPTTQVGSNSSSDSSKKKKRSRK